MKNLLNDPDVMSLYKALQNNRYKDIDDYLTSIPIFQRPAMTRLVQKPEPEFQFVCGGQKVSDFIENTDYGL